MNVSIQYATDQKGKRTPFKYRRRVGSVSEKRQHDKEYAEMKKSVTEALNEPKWRQEDKMPKILAKDFLNEL